MNYKNIKVINIEKGEGSHDQNPYIASIFLSSFNLFGDHTGLA